MRSTVADGRATYSLTFLNSCIRQIRESTLRQTLDVFKRRLDALGVRRPTVRISQVNVKDVLDQIVVELPGIDDPDRLKGLIENTGRLELKFVKQDNGGPFSSFEAAVQANDGRIPDGFEILPYRQKLQQVEYMIVKTVPTITGRDVKTARRGTDLSGKPAVNFFLNKEGAAMFSRTTERHIGERLAIVLDSTVFSAPVIRARIEDEGIIEGGFTSREADDLALLLRSGALPASVRILKEEPVSPK